MAHKIALTLSTHTVAIGAQSIASFNWRHCPAMLFSNYWYAPLPCYVKIYVHLLSYRLDDTHLSIKRFNTHVGVSGTLSCKLCPINLKGICDSTKSLCEGWIINFKRTLKTQDFTSHCVFEFMKFLDYSWSWGVSNHWTGIWNGTMNVQSCS